MNLWATSVPRRSGGPLPGMKQIPQDIRADRGEKGNRRKFWAGSRKKPCFFMVFEAKRG